MSRPTCITLAICACLIMISCSHKKDTLPTPAKEYDVFTDLAYSTDPLQKMDLYLPAGRSSANTPLVIMVHGGGWTSGDKNSAFPLYLVQRFTDQGYAVANINYRVAMDNTNKFPAQLEDIGAAIEYLYGRQLVLNINCEKIALFGRSSGAHLALLYGYTRNQHSRIKVVLDFFGPTDLTDPTIRDSTLKNESEEFIGKPYDDNAQLWHDASPIYNLTGAVPTYIFQGVYDETVYPIQSQRLRDSLADRHVPYYYDEDLVGHGLDSAGWQKHLDIALPFIRPFMFY